MSPASATPKMLSALKAARAYLAHPAAKHDSHCAYICNGGGACDCPVPAIDAAIDKAEGE